MIKLKSLMDGNAINLAYELLSNGLKEVNNNIDGVNDDIVCLIFSIRGDDELSQSVTKSLMKLNSGIYTIVLIGDYFEYPPVNCRVIERVISIIPQEVKILRPLYLRTPASSEEYKRLISAWFFQIQIDISSTARDFIRSSPGYRTANESQPVLIQYENTQFVDLADRVVGIEFQQYEPFHKSTLPAEPSAKELLELKNFLHSLPDLRYVGLPFSNQKYLQCVPEWVAGLDLRGVRPFCNVKLLKALSNLKWLNLGATNLVEIPGQISFLENLHTLLLYKNSLTHLPDFLLQLPKLTQLTCYRNMLTSLPLNDCLSKLRALNIGANHININDLDDVLSNLVAIEELGLRGLNLVNIPEQLAMFKKLKYLDISNNPFLLELDPMWPHFVVKNIKLGKLPTWSPLLQNSAYGIKHVT